MDTDRRAARRGRGARLQRDRGRRQPRRAPDGGADRPGAHRAGLGRARRHLDPDRADRPPPRARGADQRGDPRRRQRDARRARPGPTTSSTRCASPGCCSPAARRARTSPTTSPTSPRSSARSSWSSGRCCPRRSASSLDELASGGRGLRIYRDGERDRLLGSRARRRIQAGDIVVEITPTDASECDTAV